jgi:hypothetical protein
MQKKHYFLLFLILCGPILFAQQNTGGELRLSGSAAEADTPAQVIQPEKFALVIGNGSYTNLTPLANPVNDANDIAAVLEHLGFTVDKVLNGNLEQMEDAIIRLKERLRAVENGYGFFFYAGHGVQSGGENFLIPVNANIPGENFLRNRAMSVQQVLDDLNDAKNGLNVVVLDACRDNPFGWSRSGTRGLSTVTRQPADSIIVYATSAGMRASDGDGRNGLFTSQLISNLATPGLEVKEVFNRTGQDVARVSSNIQVPAIYSQFFGTAYLGETPVDFQGYIIPGATVIIGGGKKEPEPEKFWSIGASVGTSFVEPWVVGTMRGTIAPFNYSFLELGLDAGFVSGVADLGYYSFCPYLHAVFFWPFVANEIGAYAGLGGGYSWASYTFASEGELTKNSLIGDVVIGMNFFDRIDISYTLRTNFDKAISKVAVGYTYRFK